MTAYMVLDGDPDKVDVAGYTFGDILAADATGTLAAVTVGSNTSILQGESTASSGVEWADGPTVVDVLFSPQASAPSATTGAVYYSTDPEADTLTVVTSVNDPIHLGRETVVPARNTTGVTITTGQVVYINGNHTGTRLPTIALAQANALATSRALGVAAHDISNNATGHVYVIGLAHTDINTVAFSNGDPLYLSATVAGGLTATAPSAPNYATLIGFVTRAAANGAIYVTVGEPTQQAAVALSISGTGFITTGNISAGSAAFTALGPEVTVAATTGDVLELTIDSLLCNNTGSDLQVDAATRVTAADTNWWSSGTGTSRFPGGIGSWYVETSRFDSPHASARYTVQAGDVVSSQVTVQLYGRCAAGSRTVFANSSYPLRWWVTNLSGA